ncbi:unnamed protein product [Linum tenue]|uniref:Uncharacterized protein n=1 Tax=Linum tenue TaxID=586396 RepID=A0AAV0P006_9ROSI|nr:unnamed protein product [Linum tenue]
MAPVQDPAPLPETGDFRPRLPPDHRELIRVSSEDGGSQVQESSHAVRQQRPSSGPPEPSSGLLRLV